MIVAECENDQVVLLNLRHDAIRHVYPCIKYYFEQNHLQKEFSSNKVRTKDSVKILHKIHIEIYVYFMQDF